ncbi:MAG TPA: response regulator [Gemmatimonadales bacterium]|nr:response regulator [Gemmatimonadales bacterium]
MIRGAGETVLLVEDDEMLRCTTARVLAKFGYRVLAATDGVEALQAFEGNREEIRLVVSDVVMPRLDGPGLLRAIRKAGSGVSFIFTSGRSEDQLAAELDERPFRFLAKPWNVQSLARAVREALEAATPEVQPA